MTAQQQRMIMEMQMDMDSYGDESEYGDYDDEGMDGAAISGELDMEGGAIY